MVNHKRSVKTCVGVTSSTIGAGSGWGVGGSVAGVAYAAGGRLFIPAGLSASLRFSPISQVVEFWLSPFAAFGLIPAFSLTS
jgi:hypothetical protein